MDTDTGPGAREASVDDRPATPTPPADGARAAVAAEPAPSPPAAAAEPRVHPLRYWLRAALLGLAAIALLLVTWWDQRRIADRPARPDILTATPASGVAVSASDPALTDALNRLRTALLRRDARALANLADPDGVTVAAYGGGLPESGVPVPDAYRVAQDALSGAQITVLGWRSDGRGRVIVLADGWRRKTLRLGAGNALELTPLAALGLAPRAGTWYWRWLLPDGAAGALAQQARTQVWQPWPA